MKKTAEEILQEVTKHSDQFATNDEAVKAMKLYANAKLDEAAEIASVDKNYRVNTLWDASVSKQSILKLKDEI